MWQEGVKAAAGIKVANHLTFIRKLPQIIWGRGAEVITRVLYMWKREAGERAREMGV